ncbi:hypothetical protein DWX05_01995 [Coprobacillus sp. AF18-15LB]|nr:hypothetical protein DWX19_01425 [Coprobacillus sp. AF18-40]RGT87285.1 hypothetical protein DWX05_01995 [Coprobacillus sp. AF18-15LB]
MDDMTEKDLIKSRKSINSTVIKLKNAMKELKSWQVDVSGIDNFLKGVEELLNYDVGAGITIKPFESVLSELRNKLDDALNEQEVIIKEIDKEMGKF